MSSALIVRIRPAGPWRFGPDDGAREASSLIGHSDTLYSALAWAMARLGQVEEWLATTQDAQVRIGSLFPFHNRNLFVPPPRHLWPPHGGTRARWKGAKLVPLSIVEDIFAGREIAEDRWDLDGVSGCLFSAGSQPPVRKAVRSSAAIDRVGQAHAVAHQTACIEFAPNAGLWTAIVFANEDSRSRWQFTCEAAFRLLGDSGIGGERSSGWGHAYSVEFQAGEWPQVLLPAAGAGGWWMLSLYAPDQSDSVDWEHGDYAITIRSGRTTASGSQKPPSRLVTEGSVLVSGVEPRGTIWTLPGEPHPAYRCGLAVAVPVAWGRSQ